MSVGTQIQPPQHSTMIIPAAAKEGRHPSPARVCHRCRLKRVARRIRIEPDLKTEGARNNLYRLVLVSTSTTRWWHEYQLQPGHLEVPDADPGSSAPVEIMEGHGVGSVQRRRCGEDTLGIASVRPRARHHMRLVEKSVRRRAKRGMRSCSTAGGRQPGSKAARCGGFCTRRVGWRSRGARGGDWEGQFPWLFRQRSEALGRGTVKRSPDGSCFCWFNRCANQKCPGTGQSRDLMAILSCESGIYLDVVGRRGTGYIAQASSREGASYLPIVALRCVTSLPVG